MRTSGQWPVIFRERSVASNSTYDRTFSTERLLATGALPVGTRLSSRRRAAARAVFHALRCRAECGEQTCGDRGNLCRPRIDGLVLGPLQHPVEESGIEL